jgi:hypothetical protein
MLSARDESGGKSGKNKNFGDRISGEFREFRGHPEFRGQLPGIRRKADVLIDIFRLQIIVAITRSKPATM